VDSKQASTKRSGQALGWLHQKSIPQALVAEVQKAGALARAQTSYRPLKAGKERFGALHRPKVNFQSLK
jgi:hypothetical protein